MARLYDSWSFLDQRNYNPDGSMKPHKRQRLLNDGLALSEINQVENQKMLEVKKYDEREQLYMERYGIPYSEWKKQGQISQAELEERQRKAIRNGEEISTLPIAIDPDEYYDLIGNADYFDC